MGDLGKSWESGGEGGGAEQSGMCVANKVLSRSYSSLMRRISARLTEMTYCKAGIEHATTELTLVSMFQTVLATRNLCKMQNARRIRGVRAQTRTNCQAGRGSRHDDH